MKILVVDDDQNIRRLLNFNLSAAGHEVIVANNGKEGVEKAIKEKPDLILLDIMMPVMNGYEACKTLKEQDITKDIPVFMLSAKSQMMDLDDAFNVGADDYITKPFDIEKLDYSINYKLKTYNERKKTQNR
jgi:two-component system, OmpR family, alkaline phosphatase synthesis response regulator PhoP